MEFSDYVESRTTAAALTGSELLAGSQGGNARKWTVQDVADLASGGSGGGVDSVSVDVSGGTITLNFATVVSRIFIGNATFSGPKTIAYSNDANALKFEFLFTITDVAAVITLPDSSLVWNLTGVWDGSANTWTANDSGSFKFTGTFDGTNWWIEIFGYYTA